MQLVFDTWLLRKINTYQFLPILLILKNFNETIAIITSFSVGYSLMDKLVAFAMSGNHWFKAVTGKTNSIHSSRKQEVVPIHHLARQAVLGGGTIDGLVCDACCW